MTDDPTTILTRMTRAGISEDTARAHLARGVVRVSGETVEDPDRVVGDEPWVIGPG